MFSKLSKFSPTYKSVSLCCIVLTLKANNLLSPVNFPIRYTSKSSSLLAKTEMNGYTKIRLVSTTKSKSMDFSDVFSPPHAPKPVPKLSPTPASPIQDENEGTQTVHENGDGEGDGKTFGVILSRSCSTSSTVSKRFKADKQSTASIQSAVKRAFSMRRSTSVSEGYCRIYDHSDPTLGSPVDDTDDGNPSMQTNFRKKKKGSKILRVCKSLFGM